MSTNVNKITRAAVNKRKRMASPPRPEAPEVTINNSPLTSDILSEQLSKHADSIRQGFANEISILRNEFILKIEEVSTRWSQQFAELNTTVTKIVDRVNKLEESCKKNAQLHHAEINTLQKQCIALQKKRNLL